MSIATVEVVSNIVSGDTRIVVFRGQDHLGEWHNYGPVSYPVANDPTDYYSAVTAKLETSLRMAEIREAVGTALDYENPDRVPVHQSQADFDRRLLGELMRLTDSAAFLAALPFFQAVELRGGANASQRAAYLGVTTDDYALVDNRFGDVQGAAFFINDEKQQTWTTLREGWI